jgi:hypothetical protein
MKGTVTEPGTTVLYSVKSTAMSPNSEPFVRLNISDWSMAVLTNAVPLLAALGSVVAPTRVNEGKPGGG